MRNRFGRSKSVAVMLLTTIIAGSGVSGRDRLMFSHKLHFESAGASCTDCHTRIAEQQAGEGFDLPKKEICNSCHEEQVGAGPCSFCHTDPEKPGHLSTTKTHPEFSHKQHLALTSDCRRCHSNIEESRSSAASGKPQMSVCMSCHDFKQASGECRICHKDVRMRKPQSHGKRWLTKEGHGVQARVRKAECAQCHQSSACDACHRGQLSTRIHDPNYRFTHGRDVRLKSSDCSVCHETGRFCSSCH